MAGTTHKYVDGNLAVVGNLTVTGTTNLVGALQVNKGTSTSAAGAVTLNARFGTITTESITTTGQSTYTLTITNNTVTVGDVVMASVDNGSNTTGISVVQTVTPGAGTLVIKVANAATTATNPFGGTLKISFANFKQ